MKGIRFLCCALAVLLLVPVCAFAAEPTEAPVKPVRFQLGGLDGEKLYGYDAQQMTLNLVVSQPTADAAVKLWEVLKPIAKAVPVKSAPVQAGLFARMKDGSKRLLYLTEGQAYEPDTKLVYETTAKQRAELAKAASSCAAESVGGPLWLVYQSPEKITEIQYDGDENATTRYLLTLNAKDHPREVLEVGRLLQEVKNISGEAAKKLHGAVVPNATPGLNVIYVRYDSGVLYRLFQGTIYASDLGYTISYIMDKNEYQAVYERLRELSAQYGTVKVSDPSKH